MVEMTGRRRIRTKSVLVVLVVASERILVAFLNRCKELSEIRGFSAAGGTNSVKSESIPDGQEVDSNHAGNSYQEVKMESPTYSESSSTGSIIGSGNAEFMVINGIRVYNKPVVDKLLEIHSPRLALVPQPKAVSFLWKTYRRVCVDGILQPFACCIVCKRIVSYQSRTGTSSLIRHKCPPELRPILNLLREDKTPWAMTTTPVDVTQKPDILERAVKRQRQESRSEQERKSPNSYIQIAHTNIGPVADSGDSNLQIDDEVDDPGNLVLEKARQFFLKELWPISLLDSPPFVDLAQSLIDLGARAGSVQVADVLSKSAVLSDIPTTTEHTRRMIDASVFSVEFWTNYEKKRFFTLRGHILDESFHRSSVELLTTEYKADSELVDHLTQIFASIGKPTKLPKGLPETDMIIIVGDDVAKLEECIVLPSFSGFMNDILDDLCKIEDVPASCRKWKDLKEHLHEIQDDVLRAQIQGLLELAVQMFDNMSNDTVQIGACLLWWLKLQRKIQVWSSPLFERLKTQDYQFNKLYHTTLCLEPSFKSLKMIDENKRCEAYDQLRYLLKNIPKPPKLEQSERQEGDINASSRLFEEFMESEADQQTDDLDRYLRHLTNSRSDSFEFWKRSDEFPALRSLAKVLLAVPCLFSLKDKVSDLESERTMEKRFMLSSGDVFVLRYRDAYLQM